MRIANKNFSPYQLKRQQIKNNKTPEKETTSSMDCLATDESTSKAQLSQTEAPTKQEKAEKFTHYMLNRYKEFGLSLSSGLTTPKHGVAPSFSVDSKILQQAANNPEKAKELDELLYGLTSIGQNLFNAMNNPPDVKVSMSVHVNADGSSTTMIRREYSSLEARNKYHASFNANSFLDQQEELLEKHKSDFDYNEATGAKSSEKRSEKSLETRREEKKWLREFRNELQTQEWIDGQRDQRYLLYQQQQKQFLNQIV